VNLLSYLRDLDACAQAGFDSLPHRLGILQSEVVRGHLGRVKMKQSYKTATARSLNRILMR
jgi:hypothetical protein